MSPFRTLTLAALASTVCAHAAELAIETKPFEVVCSLNARVMPAADVPLIQLDAKAWQSFPIIELADHGSTVKKGDLLIEFDSRAIDRRLAELERQLTDHELELAAAVNSLARLKESAPHRLEMAKREAAIAKEALDFFTESGRKAEEEETRHTIERNRQWLENEREELRQLEQMYKADDLTEDTEEIILTRQKNSVAHAELMLRLSELRQTRALEVLLPRKAENLSNAMRDAGLERKYAELEIPLAIGQASARVEALEATLKQDRQTFTDLEQDRKLFRIVAAADGLFYHGEVSDGRWTTGELLRNLRVGGAAPLRTPLATLIPKDTALLLVAHTDAGVARQLSEHSSGVATLAGTEAMGAEQSAVPVQVTRSELIPGPKGKHQVELKADWPKALPVATGQPAKVHLLVYHQPETVVIPANALRFGKDGWSVELKLADGKTERRPVTRGPSSEDSVEILSGLEAGQVIITP